MILILCQIESCQNPHNIKIVWISYNINKNLYSGQDYVLQIDSHTRFIQDWDEMYIEDYLQFNEEVILTGFPPQYKLGDLYDDYKIYPSNNAVKPRTLLRK